MPDSSVARPQATEVGAFLPSFQWLISPIRTEAFFRDYWEKQALVVNRSHAAYFAPLLSLEEVDRVLTTLDRRYPDVTLKQANRELSADDYTVGGETLDVARVYQLFEEGATVALAYLDTVLPALTLFCRRLESEFSCPLQTNVYLAPPGAQGAKPHYDTHDVFVLQVSGSKRWTLYGTPVELPLSGQDFDAAVHPCGAPTREFELQAGDVAYVPRGLVHDARSSDSVSLHITAGVLRYTWTDLLVELVCEIALRDAAFRKAIPPGFARPEFDRGPAKETLRNLLQRIAAEGDFDVTLDRFVDEFMSSCPPLVEGQMAQMLGLGGLTLDGVVGARTGVTARLREDKGSAVVECYGRTITFPPQAREAVRFALGRTRWAVRDLPGGLDPAGKLALVRRLIREGLVSVLPA